MKSIFVVTILLLLGHTICLSQERPNVILIITDDQGYGDLGYTGNPHVKTPNIDALAKESTRLNNFYVSPVCAPTRSSLMTGRYSLRTGVRDTYNGGAIMSTEEVTIAEMLKQADYRTGMFGKWHLGDSYPGRPNDQGFDESVIHLSGGMAQVGDFTTYFKGDSAYFDPVLWHNGEQRSYKGYCSDIFADQAIQFIEQNKAQPFFCYLSFNAPHTPLQLPEEYYEMYKDIDPSSGFDDDRPFYEMTEKNKEDARKVYGMVTNIDDNVGKLLNKLDELELANNTIVIFMTDNGPQQQRYLAGLRGLKSSVYSGGVKVPFFIRYPGELEADSDIEVNTAHIDILPTLAALCDVDLPNDRVVDGKNLVPLFRKENVDWTDRPLFFYWTRRYPERYNNVALQKGPLKLVGHTDYDAEISEYELYNIEEDPFELNNIISSERTKAAELKETLVNYFDELTQSPNLTTPQPIVIGTEYENPVYLNRNDADGERGIWGQEEIFGKWNVEIREGIYDIAFRFVKPVQSGGTLYLETNSLITQMKVEAGPGEMLEMKNVKLPAIKGDLLPYYIVGNRRILPFWVKLTRID